MKVIYSVPVPDRLLPCGYIFQAEPFKPGRMMEARKHYETCQHPFCQWRFRVKEYISKKFRAGIVKKKA